MVSASIPLHLPPEHYGEDLSLTARRVEHRAFFAHLRPDTHRSPSSKSEGGEGRRYARRQRVRWAMAEAVRAQKGVKAGAVTPKMLEAQRLLVLAANSTTE